MSSNNHPECALITFAYEIGYLKRSARTGWYVAGIPGKVESVAEHSFRTAILAHLVAVAEDADPERAALLGLYHDVPETRIGDIPHLARRYLTATDPETIIKDQTGAMPEPIAAAVRNAVSEFEAGQTIEAVCARDADKLECLLQAREYQLAGARDVDTWVETSQAKIVTATGQALATQARETEPGVWWRNVQAGQ